MLLCLAAITCPTMCQVISLDGEWVLTNSNKSVHTKATVPGQVQLDLLKAKLIPDPYFRMNDVLTQWVAHDSWTYSRNFDASDVSSNAVVDLKSCMLTTR